MKQHHSLFIGFKTSRAIPVRHALTRDLLIQSTLDGGVCRIDYQPVPRSVDSIVPHGVIILERSDGRFAIDVKLDEKPAFGGVGEALMDVAFAKKCDGIIVVDPDDIMSEPRLSSAREVWSYRTMRVYADDRTEILGTLEREGPTEIGRFERMVITRGDARASLYAMACDGTVELDMSRGLGPDALVLPSRFGGSMLMTAFGA